MEEKTEDKKEENKGVYNPAPENLQPTENSSPALIETTNGVTSVDEAKEKEKEYRAKISTLLQNCKMEIIELVSIYGPKWKKVSKQVKNKFGFEPTAYEVRSFYNSIPVAERTNVLENKKRLPEMIEMYLDLLEQTMAVLKTYKEKCESSGCPMDPKDFTCLVKEIIDIRKELARITGETAWNTKVMTVIRECTEFFTKILQKHLPKEKVLEIILDWNNIIPAVNERNRI